MPLQNSSNEQLPALELRAARPDEYPHAAEMRREMSVEQNNDFDARSSGWRARYCAYFSEKQEAGKAQLFLAFDGTKPVGMTIVSLLENYRTAIFGVRFAYVNSVYVYPPYRRRGIARRLMEMALAWAREHECTQVRLRASDDGRPLYEQLGFRASTEMQLDL
jgi:GNAT superfamily N-acetyltransferase